MALDKKISKKLTLSKIFYLPLIYKMSRNRKPNKATTEEIREFYKKTKDIISKNGLYYDSITKKYKKALKQDGKAKGSGRALVADSKYKNFLKKLSEDERGDMTSLEQRARDKGFSQLQKERKLFGMAGAAAVGADMAAQASVMKKAQDEAPAPATNIRRKSAQDGANPQDGLKVLSDKGSPVNTPAQTKLKKRKDKVKLGLPPTATDKDVENAKEDAKRAVEEFKSSKKSEEKSKGERREEKEKVAEGRGIQSGNLRKKKREEGEKEQEAQAEKIQEAEVVDNDKPLHDLADVEHDIDHQTERPFVPKGEEQIAVEQPNLKGGEGNRRKKGEGFYEEPTTGQPKEEPIPVPQEEGNVKMEITDKPDLEVEIDKSPMEGVPQMGQSFISPASEKVSMERNRMKYSPKRFYEECRSFVKIYSDDIKTPSFKKLVEKFSKMSEKSSVEVLRKIHRELEEEVIEYYQGRKGLRLGVIIDPSVLGINVAQLQGLMAPQMPMAMGSQVTEVGTQARRVKTKDIHYHLGGRQHATNAVLPEGDNLEKHETEKKHTKGRVTVPIVGRQNWLLKKSGRSRIPKNLKIR